MSPEQVNTSKQLIEDRRCFQRLCARLWRLNCLRRWVLVMRL